MYFSKTTALALIAAIPAVLASPLLDTRQNGASCETSDGSPLTADITDLINQLRGQGGVCPQTNPAASMCTELVKGNSAAIVICGGVDDEFSGPLCSDVADRAATIQDHCKNKGNPARSGGQSVMEAGKRVEVINVDSL